jgi:IclR family acetate operon transcriptional repressor
MDVMGQRRTAHSIQSVCRALDVLEALARDDLGLVELGRQTGLQPSTTHRMLATLCERGYVSRRPSGVYGLGRRAGNLGAALWSRERALKAAAHPVMQRVQMVSRHAANLAVLDGGHVVYVASVSSSQRLGASFGETRLPAHASASGKALIAFSEIPRRESPPPRGTPRTISDSVQLGAELDVVRQRGWAFGHEESGVEASVAAPIFGQSGAVLAALSVAGPQDHVTRDRDDLADLVLDATHDISVALGRPIAERQRLAG